MASTRKATWGMVGSKDLLDNYSLSNSEITDRGWEKGLWLTGKAEAGWGVYPSWERGPLPSSAVLYYPRDTSTLRVLCMPFISIRTEGKTCIPTLPHSPHWGPICLLLSLTPFGHRLVWLVLRLFFADIGHLVILVCTVLSSLEWFLSSLPALSWEHPRL